MSELAAMATAEEATAAAAAVDAATVSAKEAGMIHAHETQQQAAESAGTSVEHSQLQTSSASDASDPWVLRLGTYLQGGGAPSTASDEPWAVRLGNYLSEKKPGPWSIVANEKPEDPLALRLGNFLNETKPVKMLHPSDAEAESEADPLVLRLGKYLNGEGEPSPARSGADLPQSASASVLPPVPETAGETPSVSSVAHVSSVPAVSSAAHPDAVAAPPPPVSSEGTGAAQP